MTTPEPQPPARAGDRAAMRAVMAERGRQETLWGQQNHPDGTGLPSDHVSAEKAKAQTEAARAAGELTWSHVLLEEIAEAMAETDTNRLRQELVQAGAVIVGWIAALDRRTARPATKPAEPGELLGRIDALLAEDSQ